MSQNGQRRKWTAAEKLRIVLAGMQPNVEVSELCRREGINPTQYYGWKKQLLSSATKIFDGPESKRSGSEEKKEAERRRSGWPAKKTVAALGVPRRTYYRWLQEEAWARVLPAEPVRPVRPVQPYEALPEEKAAVLAYARRHPELRHRELAWRMVDEDVAYLSASTVYRIL